MSGTAWLDINGTQYKLALGQLENAHAQQLTNMQQRVESMLTDSGPGVQFFDIAPDDAGSTRLVVVVENVTTATVMFRADPAAGSEVWGA